jgi:hypothetical protein
VRQKELFNPVRKGEENKTLLVYRVLIDMDSECGDASGHVGELPIL